MNLKHMALWTEKRIYIPWIHKCVTKTVGDGTSYISYGVLVNSELNHVSSDSCYDRHHDRQEQKINKFKMYKRHLKFSCCCDLHVVWCSTAVHSD